MSTLRHEALSGLSIAADQKVKRRRGPAALIGTVVVLILIGLVVLVVTRHAERKPIPLKDINPAAAETNAAPVRPGGPVLTVSGYVIPRERIEISPKFMGTVTWIGVKKGDAVKKGDVLVRLEDNEYQARVREAEGRLMMAWVNLSNAVLNLDRQRELARNNADSQRALDDAVRAHGAAEADVVMAEGQLSLAQTWLDWCTIRAPIDGTILEKLVNPNELVAPQSFGGSRGPSTAFLAMADLMDLQVEIDLNEADTPKVFLNQACTVSPEAYPDRHYDGYVAEIAPEASRSKGTLQVKVQIRNPDHFLTPELTAKVDFLPAK